MTRNLRRRFEAERSPSKNDADFTLADLRRAAAAAKDLDDRHVMQNAWR
jgi:hypothetical protein